MTARRHKSLDGYLCTDRQRPTMRERWVAFHRLYRLSKRGCGYRDAAAAECLFLMTPVGWVSLMEQEVKRPRSDYPAFLRRRLLDSERRRRLFGPGWRWLDGCRAVANHLRKQGREVTPEQVAEVRHKIIRIAREKAIEHGFVLPADDDAVLRMLRK